MKTFIILALLLAVIHCEVISQQKSLSSRRAFVENNGQMRTSSGEVNSDVLYSTMSSHLNIQLRRNGFSYDCSFRKDDGTGYAIERIDVDFLNVNPTMKVVPSEKQSAVINDYRNGNSDGIRSSTFGMITYYQVYQGVDVAFRVNKQNQVEYDIIVHPEGNLGDVLMQVNGPTEVSWDNGLVVQLAHGELRERVPSVYERETQRPIELSAHVEGNILSFSAQHNEHSTLVIDPVPVLTWSTYFGGEGQELAEQIAYVDGTGDQIIVGWTHSTTGIATSGAHQSTKSDTSDAYVAMFDSSGNLKWATYYGGPLDEIFAGVTTYQGEIYAIGFSYSPTGIATQNVYQTTLSGAHDAIIANFASDGTLRWCTYYGGPEGDEGVSIGVTSQGKLIVTSATGNDGLGTLGSYQGFDILIAEFTTDGRQRNWARYFGGTGYEEPTALVISPFGDDIVVCGITGSQDGIATPSSFQKELGGNVDGFLVRLASDGRFLWSTYVGGEGYEWVNDVSNNSVNEVYVTGYTESPDSIGTAGTAQPNYAGNGDGFLMKFDSTGALVWGTYVGGPAFDEAHASITFRDWDCIVVGQTMSDDVFGFSTPYGNSRNGLLSDGFIRMYVHGDGTSQWSAYVGGTGNDKCTEIATEFNNQIYVIGETQSDDLNATSGAHQETYGGVQDAFLMRIDLCDPPNPIVAASSACLNRNGTTYSTTHVPGNTYAWSFPPEATVISGLDSSTVVVLWSVPGMVVVSVLETAPLGCDAKGILQTEILPEFRPDVQSVTGELEACEGDTIFLKAQDGLYDYTWNTSDTGQILAVTTSGFYQVSASDTTAMCSGASDSVSVTFQPLPDTDISGASSVCLTGGPIEDYKVILATGDQIMWTDPVLGDAVSSLSESIVSIEWKQSGIDTLRATVFSQNGCEGTGLYEVMISDSLMPAISSLNGQFTFCEGDSITLIADTTITPATYLWSTGETIYKIVVKQSGSYWVRVSDGQCSGTSQIVNAVLSPSPSPMILGSSAVCRTDGDSIIYAVQNTVGNTYQWLDPALGTIITPNDQSQITIQWHSIGIDTVGVIETSVAGCKATAGQIVTISEGVLVTISEDNGDLVADFVAADEYQWLNDAMQPISGATGQRFTPSAGGTYYVEVRTGVCWSRSMPFNFDGMQHTDKFSVSDVDFGSLPINLLVNASGGHVNEIIVANLSQSDIALDSASLQGEGFDVPNQFPRLLRPGDTSRITVRFKPTEKREYTATVVIHFGGEIGFSQLRGVGRDLAPDERITEVILQPDRLEVIPGEQFEVILSIGAETPTTTAGQQYEATMQWDARVLELVSTPEVFFRTTGREDNYYTAKIPEGVRNAGQVQLIRIPFRAKLGEIDSTVLVFSGAIAFRWKDDTKAFPACRDSVVHVKICREGGQRLITKRNSASIARVAPHPVDNRASIFIDATGTMDVTAELIDPLGSVVQQHHLGTILGGRTDVQLDMSGLHAGPYILRLNYGDGTTSRIVIRRP